MKRFIALFLAILLLLCACGKDEPVETTAETTVPPTVPPTTVAPTTEPETVPPTEETEPPVNLIHPLTGEVLDEPYASRPVSVSINNAPACLPQHGVSQADWFYEVETEGGVTRCLGFFTDLDNIDVIGPVRSARSYFLSLTGTFCAPLAHCGGSPFALSHQHAYNMVYENYLDIDEQSNPSYFYRDSDRRNRGYAYEHTLFTTGENLKEAMVDKGFDYPISDNGVSYGYTYAEDASLKGDSAKELMVTFLGGKTTSFSYNGESGRYEAAQRGSDWIDGNTGEVLCFENVFVLYADQNKSIHPPHSFYELYGEGTGYLAIGGKIVPITWQRDSVTRPYVFSLEDGTPVTLHTGHTYLAVISPSGSVTFS